MAERMLDDSFRHALGKAVFHAILLMSLIVGATASSWADSSADRASAQPPHLGVTVDPRIELLSAVQDESDWAVFATQNGAWAKRYDPYRRDMDKWFAPYKHHLAVTEFNTLLSGGFGFDAPVAWILHYDAISSMRQYAPLDQDTLQRGGGQAKLDALAAAFRDFARTSHFQAFFDHHKLLYESLASTYRETSPPDSVLTLIEGFYGERKAAYTVNIAPMFGGGNFGTHVLEPDGEHIYNTGAPVYRNGQYSYRQNLQTSLMFHEFSHSFTNPAVDADKARYKEYADLFPSIRYKMEPQAYADWHIVVIELMTRTNEIRLMQLDGKEAAADSLEKDYLDKGFYWLPFTLARLNEYESNRSKYPTYRSFINRMFDVFDETSPVIKDGKMVGVAPKTVGTVN